MLFPISRRYTTFMGLRNALPTPHFLWWKKGIQEPQTLGFQSQIREFTYWTKGNGSYLSARLESCISAARAFPLDTSSDPILPRKDSFRILTPDTLGPECMPLAISQDGCRMAGSGTWVDPITRLNYEAF